MLPHCRVIADIGCDHGKLAMYLLQTEKCQSIIATDISAASLQKAIDASLHLGLNDHVVFRVGDGLSVLAPNEVQAVFIGGMGGLLISRIIKAAESTASALECMVLAPMQQSCLLRRFLRENGFRIEAEEAVREGSHVYPILRVVKGVSDYPVDMDAEFLDDFGPKLWQQRSSLLIQKLRRRHREYEMKIRLGREEYVHRIALIDSALTLIKEEPQ